MGWKVLPTYKNELLEIILQSELSSRRFEFSHSEEKGFRISYVESEENWWFEAKEDGKDTFSCKSNPAFILSSIFWTVGGKHIAECKWPEVKAQFADWLTCIRKELNNELDKDEWTEYERINQEFRWAENVSTTKEKPFNTQFSYSEVGQIEASISQLKTSIVEAGLLTSDQLIETNAKLDYLIDHAKKGTGRVDWKNLAIGQFIQIIYDFAMSPALYPSVETVSWIAKMGFCV